jgi:hypothetical protein
MRDMGSSSVVSCVKVPRTPSRFWSVNDAATLSGTASLAPAAEGLEKGPNEGAPTAALFLPKKDFGFDPEGARKGREAATETGWAGLHAGGSCERSAEGCREASAACLRLGDGRSDARDEPE